MRLTLQATAVAAIATLAAPVAVAAGTDAYHAANASEVCGYLPYRADGDARFETGRDPAETANVGPQATYPFAWDLARPSFLAAEIADDLIAGRSIDEVRGAHGAALSLGEFMLHAARQLEAEPAAPASDDERLALAAERPLNFHRLYTRSKRAYEAIVAHVTPDGPETPAMTLKEIARDWRPAYAVLAKAQADDKRVELISTELDADAVAEREAVACLAHAVAILAGDADVDAVTRAKASAARWPLRPLVNARALSRAARVPFFDYEDAGDALAQAVAALPATPPGPEAVRQIGGAYATFVTAAKALHEASRAETQ